MHKGRKNGCVGGMHTDELLDEALIQVIAARLVTAEAALKKLAARSSIPDQAAKLETLGVSAQVIAEDRQGPQGPEGPQGPRGDRGPAGDTGPMPRHEWRGSWLRFEIEPNKWGQWTNLRGPAGPAGAGGGFSVVSDLTGLAPGVSEIEPVGVAVLQGGKWVNLPWGALMNLISGVVGSDTFARRVDFLENGSLYRGEAAPGAAEVDPVWRIRRIEFAPDGDVSETWAGGSDAFAHVWTDRAALQYA